MKVSTLASVQVPPFTHGLLEHAGHGTKPMNEEAKVLVRCLSNVSNVAPNLAAVTVLMLFVVSMKSYYYMNTNVLYGIVFVKKIFYCSQHFSSL